jgi:hypothetical protein
MPLDNKDKTSINIPAGSTLCTKVVTVSNHVDATGAIDHPDNSKTNLTHSAIMKRKKCVVLDEVGTHIARVTLIFNATGDETATVEYSLIDANGTESDSFKPVFAGKSSGKDKFVARAKWAIDVI